MWKPFIYENNNYLIKFANESPCEITLTDFKRVYCEQITREDLIVRFQQLNPLIELNEDDTIKEIENLMENDSIVTEVDIDENRAFLDITNVALNDFKIKFSFCMEKNENCFFAELTKPLVQTVQFLELKQKQLLDVIKKKEEEIREYELEKGLISRSTKITPKFDFEALKTYKNGKLLLGTLSNSNEYIEGFDKNNGSLFDILPDLRTTLLKKKRTENVAYAPKNDNLSLEGATPIKKIKTER